MAQGIRRATLAGAMTALALAAAPTALAAPNGQMITAECTNGATLQVVTPPSNDSEHAQNDFTPGFIVGTHQVVVPYVFTFTAVDSATGQTYTETSAKRAPVPAGAIDCSFDLGTMGTFTMSGEVIGVVR